MRLQHALLLSALAWVLPPAKGQTSTTRPADEELVRGIRISDAPLLDQNGSKVRFADFLKGKVVVINTVFTSCPTICPVMGVHFAALTKILGSRAGREVSLISITVDPVKDTPAKLKAWSEKFHPGQGWTLLTGDPKDVESVLRGLRLFAVGPANHSPMTLFGDTQKAEWRRATGLQSAERLAALIPPYPAGARTDTKRSGH